MTTSAQDQLRALVREAGITATAALAGVSLTHLCNWCNGKHEMRAVTLAKVANALGYQLVTTLVKL